MSLKMLKIKKKLRVEPNMVNFGFVITRDNCDHAHQIFFFSFPLKTIYLLVHLVEMELVDCSTTENVISLRSNMIQRKID